tara:strand:+ start:391 stop:741 length:351 start_codon:yes stop_codon:yes gene_type:complete
MKVKNKKYAFKTEESYPAKEDYCHYSGLPSPSAYGRDDIDYDGMGNQGRVPIMNGARKKIVSMEKYAMVGLALLVLVYSVCLGLAGYTEEAQYSANWPGTILLFTIAINQIRRMNQ